MPLGLVERIVAATRFASVFLAYLALLLVVALLVLVIFYISDREVLGLILAYLDVLIWPILVIALVLLFRSKLSELIGRIIEVDTPLGSATILPDEAQSEPLDPSEQIPLPESEDVEQILKEKEEEIAGLRTNEEGLIRNLSQAKLELEFERIYSSIFGSQIQLLQYIQTYPSVDFSVVAAHFEDIKKKFAPAFEMWTAADYLKYLDTTGLTQYLAPTDGTGETAKVSITERGRAFLEYLGARNYQKYGYF